MACEVVLKRHGPAGGRCRGARSGCNESALPIACSYGVPAVAPVVGAADEARGRDDQTPVSGLAAARLTPLPTIAPIRARRINPGHGHRRSKAPTGPAHSASTLPP